MPKPVTLLTAYTRLEDPDTTIFVLQTNERPANAYDYRAADKYGDLMTMQLTSLVQQQQV